MCILNFIQTMQKLLNHLICTCDISRLRYKIKNLARPRRPWNCSRNIDIILLYNDFTSVLLSFYSYLYNYSNLYNNLVIKFTILFHSCYNTPFLYSEFTCLVNYFSVTFLNTESGTSESDVNIIYYINMSASKLF